MKKGFASLVLLALVLSSLGPFTSRSAEAAEGKSVYILLAGDLGLKYFFPSGSGVSGAPEDSIDNFLCDALFFLCKIGGQVGVYTPVGTPRLRAGLSALGVTNLGTRFQGSFEGTSQGLIGLSVMGFPTEGPTGLYVRGDIGRASIEVGEYSDIGLGMSLGTGLYLGEGSKFLLGLNYLRNHFDDLTYQSLHLQGGFVF